MGVLSKNDKMNHRFFKNYQYINQNIRKSNAGKSK